MYEGTIMDFTGQDEVTVEVGAGDVGFAFSPAAIRIDSS
ncbi:halocyanin, partial [Halorubrum ezzemoulense]